MFSVPTNAFRSMGVPWLVAVIWLAAFTCLRIGLLITLDAGQVGIDLWPYVLAKGLLFDLATLAFLVAPVCLYEAVLPNRWRTSLWHKTLRFKWLWFSVFVMLFGIGAEVTFWLEFSTRFNFIAVDYLLYTQEVIGNIRQSYPVPTVLAAIAVVAGLIVWFLRGAVRNMDNVKITRIQRAKLVAAGVVLPVIAGFTVSVDQMEGAGNAYADEISGNGLFTLAAAMRRNELDFDRFYRTMPQSEADRILRTMGMQRRPLSDPSAQTLRGVANHAWPFTRRPRNVVLISVESLSASFLGAYGDSRGLTPRLDALAKQGLLFSHAYATGTRTVRGLEALSLGTPPVPGQAIVRRPQNEHLATLGEVLGAQGFKPYFFYGGYGYFDNMNAYFGGNGYKVIDRTDMEKRTIVFENVWGVADEVLFSQALSTLDEERAQSSPFFAHIMTTSNHRPYTYPAGRIDIPSPGGRLGAVKYTDFAIGDFIDRARAQPWFKDTLFIIVADHGASVAGKTKLPLDGYRIPLIFFAPDLLKPSVYEPLVSQLDLAPTIVELLGKKGADYFFGRCLFEEEEPLRRVFVSNYQSLGYLRSNTLTVLLPRQRVESYRVDPRTLETTPKAVDPVLLNEAIAYYQTASRSFKLGALKLPNCPHQQ